MPPPLLKSLAARATPPVSVKKMETRWDRAKKIVSDEYGLDESDPRFWSLTTGVVKKMSGIKEHTTFKQYLESYPPSRTASLVKKQFPSTVEHPDPRDSHSTVTWVPTGKIGTTISKPHTEVAEYQYRGKDGDEDHRIWADRDGVIYPN